MITPCARPRRATSQPSGEPGTPGACLPAGQKKARFLNRAFEMVPKAGLEPARLTPLPPQDSVSTNSTTSAKTLFILPYRSCYRWLLQPLRPLTLLHPQRLLEPPAFRRRQYLQLFRFFQHLFALASRFFPLRPPPVEEQGYRPGRESPLALQAHPANR
jgi:hypothetical protein